MWRSRIRRSVWIDVCDSVVPGKLRLEQPVFFLRAASNVVNYQRPLSHIRLVTDDHDMREVWRHNAGNDVTWLIIARLF